MKTYQTACFGKLLFFAFTFFLCSNFVFAQTDSLKTVRSDTTITKKDKDEKKGDKKKRKDEFIVYAGVNFNKLFLSSDISESNILAGYHIGFDYKRGKFFYWQVGLRYNNAIYKMSIIDVDSNPVESQFYIRDFDIPVTGGINFLSALNRIVALRIFVSAVTAFAFDVGENDFGITKDDINTFNLYGQAGLGVNLAFIVLEAGYNYGFIDMFQNSQSKPGQVFINLGFRF
jgi:hypothetical protein